MTDKTDPCRQTQVPNRLRNAARGFGLAVALLTSAAALSGCAALWGAAAGGAAGYIAGDQASD